jgi:hypothetical protein
MIDIETRRVVGCDWQIGFFFGGANGTDLRGCRQAWDGTHGGGQYVNPKPDRSDGAQGNGGWRTAPCAIGRL